MRRQHYETMVLILAGLLCLFGGARWVVRHISFWAALPVYAMSLMLLGAGGKRLREDGQNE